MSGNILFLGNKIFEIPPFFQTRPGDLGKKAHACSLRFSALKLETGGHFACASVRPLKDNNVGVSNLIAGNRKLA